MPETTPKDLPKAVVADGPSGVADESELDEATAEKVEHIIAERAANSGQTDFIFVLEDWAHAEWSDAPQIAQSKVLLASRAEDYSAKAYKLQSAVEVEMSVLDGQSMEEVKNDYLTRLVAQVDETDEDFIDNKGEKFLPKSAVQAVLVLAE